MDSRSAISANDRINQLKGLQDKNKKRSNSSKAGSSASNSTVTPQQSISVAGCLPRKHRSGPPPIGRNMPTKDPDDITAIVDPRRVGRRAGTSVSGSSRVTWSTGYSIGMAESSQIQFDRSEYLPNGTELGELSDATGTFDDFHQSYLEFVQMKSNGAVGAGAKVVIDQKNCPIGVQNEDGSFIIHYLFDEKWYDFSYEQQGEKIVAHEPPSEGSQYSTPSSTPGKGIVVPNGYNFSDENSMASSRYTRTRR